jgi:hypothetical protein
MAARTRQITDDDLTAGLTDPEVRLEEMLDHGEEVDSLAGSYDGADYNPLIGAEEERWPKLGDTVWYRSGDATRGYPWYEATVVDRLPNPTNEEKPQLLDTPMDGTLHLELRLPRDTARSPRRAYRQHVPGPYEGQGGNERKTATDVAGYEYYVGPPDGCGQWAWEKPAYAEQQRKAHMDKRALDKQYWRESHRNPTAPQRTRDRPTVSMPN